MRIESGESRLQKIVQLIKSSKFSIHDLSRCKAKKRGEHFRMNMPFEFGVDHGLRESGAGRYHEKKFLIFETNRFDLKPSLSDIAGQDVEFHNGNAETLIGKVRDFFRVEGQAVAVAPTAISANYATFLGWLTEKKIDQGFPEDKALSIPTQERIEEIKIWLGARRPAPPNARKSQDKKTRPRP